MTRQRAILNFLDEMSTTALHAFRLSLHGQCIAQGAWAPYSLEEPHRLYSVSKSVTALGIGILMGEGKLRLDDPIINYFPEWVDDHTPQMLREVTIRHMLMMSTCFERAQYNIHMDDWTKPFFYGTPNHPAGTMFNYDTSASQVMCALVAKLSGQDTLSFMEEKLFRPLGMNGPKIWLKDRQGVCQGGTGLVMTMQDFSTLADFCMSDGKGLIPADYLKEATSCLVSTSDRSAPEERHGYGYQIWQMRKGFAMYGMGGQMAMCLPEQGLSLCTFGDTMLRSTGVQPIYDAFFRHLDGVGELPDDAADQAELDARLAALQLMPVKAAAAQESLHIDLVRAELPFHALDIYPGKVVFHQASGESALPYAVGGWADSMFLSTNQKCIASGGWTTDTRFTLACEIKDTFTCGFELTVAMNGGKATLRLCGSMRELIDDWNGTGWGVASPIA